MSFSKSSSKVFVSYSHKDEKHLSRLFVHLTEVERKGSITLWSDKQISPRSNWREEIKEAVARAEVAILLVSADFLASEFIANNELPPLLEAAKKRGTHILPIILSPCDFNHVPLSQFQSINNPSKPVSKMNLHQREDLWAEVTNTVRNIVMRHKDNHDEPSPEELRKLFEISYGSLPITKPRLFMYGLPKNPSDNINERELHLVEEYIEEPTILAAPVEIAEGMNISPEGLVVRRFRKLGPPNVPYRIYDVYFPKYLITDTMFGKMKEPDYDVLPDIKSISGLYIKHVFEDVFARFPTEQEQGLLKIVRTNPVVDIVRIGLDPEQKTVIMYNHTVLNANYFLLKYNYSVDYINAGVYFRQERIDHLPR